MLCSRLQCATASVALDKANILREKGLEPLRPKALDPKSSVSTYSTTLAQIVNEPYRNRTCNLQIKSLLLYQLS